MDSLCRSRQLGGLEMRLSLVLASMWLLLNLFSSAGPQETKRDSPEVAFDAYKNAMANNNYRAMYSQISPALQDGMIIEAIFAMGSGASSDKADAIMEKYIDKKRFEKIWSTQKDHQPTEKDISDCYLQSITDKQKFFIESWTYLRVDRKRKKPQAKFANLSNLKIENVVSSGKSKLTSIDSVFSNDGRLVESTQTTEIDVYFVKSKGKWIVASKSEWSQLRKLEKGKEIP